MLDAGPAQPNQVDAPGTVSVEDLARGYSQITPKVSKPLRSTEWSNIEAPHNLQRLSCCESVNVGRATFRNGQRSTITALHTFSGNRHEPDRWRFLLGTHEPMGRKNDLRLSRSRHQRLARRAEPCRRSLRFHSGPP